MASYLDTGMFIISASMKPENLGEVLTLIYDEIETAKQQPLDEKTMFKAKQQFKGNYILGLENVSSRMQSIGRAKLLLDKVRTPEEILGRIERINPENTYDCTKGNIRLCKDERERDWQYCRGQKGTCSGCNLYIRKIFLEILYKRAYN